MKKGLDFFILYAFLWGTLIGFYFGVSFSRVDASKTIRVEIGFAPTSVPTIHRVYGVVLPTETKTPKPTVTALSTVYAGESIYFSDVPVQWIVCVNEGTKVYNNPGENPDWYIYSLEDGTPVMVRELDSSREWAMIQPAEYVRFTDLCRP